MGVGGLLQAAANAREVRAYRVALRAQRSTLGLAALAVGVYPLAFYSSMRLAGVAIGTVVSIGSAPAAAAVIERVADLRPLSRRWAAGTAVGLLGVIELAVWGTHATATASTDTRRLWGVILGVAAGVTYACYSWGAARVMRSGVPPGPTMGTIFGMGGVLLAPVLVATGAPILQSARNLAAASYMAAVPMFVGYVLFGRGLASISASTATTISLLEPAVATLLATVVLHEQLAPAGWAGLVAIGFSVVILAVAPKPAS
jgi:DME family drug/metabolite transporter